MLTEKSGTLAAYPGATGCEVPIDRLPARTEIRCGNGSTWILPGMDFETYSEAGYEFGDGKRRSILGKGKKGGLPAVGAAAYAEHPSAEILSLAYNLHDGDGVKAWIPGMEPPSDLLDYMARGGIMKAHNAFFEIVIWLNVATRQLGWPRIDPMQFIDTAALARLHNMPGQLARLADALGIEGKIGDGKRLIQLFSVPQQNGERVRMTQRPTDAWGFIDYNKQDVSTESTAAAHLPFFDRFELQVYRADLDINLRGCQIDLEALADMRAIVDQARRRYEPQIEKVTGGAVQTANQVAKIGEFLADQGFPVPDLGEETVTAMLKRDDLTEPARKVLWLRQQLGVSSLAKLETIHHRVSYDGRLRDLFNYCGASQTRRWAGQAAQPQNLPGDGCPVEQCGNCGDFHAPGWTCASCGTHAGQPVKWSAEAAEFFIQLAQARDLDYLLRYTDRPLEALSGCLRGLFIAAPGYELNGCDFSAIEAIVLACLSGEQWRIDLFNDHGKIYEMTASQISGVPFEEIVEYKEKHGQDHPLRKTLGKVAELASGYQGGVGAWLAFGAGGFMTEDEIKQAVKAWRKANPAIVKFWYALEDCAKDAVRYPGQPFRYRQLTFIVQDNTLYCYLPSGGSLKYHSPFLRESETPWGAPVTKLFFYGVDSQTGKLVLKDTYGGRLAENVTQAVARDIQANGMLNARHAGLPVVLHVHDELTAETPIGSGGAVKLAQCMNRLPDWCVDWPVKVPPGWTGQRYCKD